MEYYKEGYLMVWTNYMSPCSSIVGLYLKGTCDVISVTMAQKCPLNFSFCKLSEKLIRWPTIFIYLLESSLNYLTFQTVRKKNCPVELNIFKENAFYGLQKILLHNFSRNFYIWSAIANGTCMQKIKIGHWAKFWAKSKCFLQILFPVRAVLRSI